MLEIATETENKKDVDNMINKLREELHKEKHLLWNFWRTINRIKVAYGHTKKNTHKWGLLENDKHECIQMYRMKYINILMSEFYREMYGRKYG